MYEAIVILLILLSSSFSTSLSLSVLLSARSSSGKSAGQRQKEKPIKQPNARRAAGKPQENGVPPKAEKMLTDLGPEVRKLYDWTIGKDKLWYVTSSSVSAVNRAKCLDVLVQVNGRLRSVSEELVKSFGQNSTTSKFIDMLNQRDTLKASFIGLMDDQHPVKFGYPKGSVGALATHVGIIVMSEGWCLEECANTTFGECIGSVLHELAHAICPAGSCPGHGKEFCRVQAMLHQAAIKAGVYSPVSEQKKKWAANLPAMAQASYSGDCLQCCDTNPRP